MKKFFNKPLSDRAYTIIILAGLAIMMLLFIRLSYEKEYWYDEMASIGYVASDVSITNVLDYYQTIEATNLPVYPIILYVFYHLFGSHIMSVCMPTALFTLAAIWFLTDLAKRWIGKRAGLIMLILCMFSTTMINRGAMTVRAYALMIFAAGAALSYLYRILKGEKCYVRFSIVLALLVYSHYFGTLLCALLGIFVLALVLAKRMNKIALFPFLIAGLLFLPWFYITMVSTPVNVGSFWIDPPTMKKVFDALGFILGSSFALCGVFGITYIIALVKAIKLKFSDVFLDLVLALPAVIMGMIFVYSRFINPSGGLFENRYFMVMIPACYLTITFGIDVILAKINLYKGKAKIGAFIILSVLVVATLIEMGYRIYEYGDVEQYARYSYSGRHIHDAGDVADDRVLVMALYQNEVGRICQEGWYDYYFRTKNKEAAHIEIIDADDMNDVILEYEDIVDKIYVFGDTEFLDADGTGFEETYQASFYNYTIYEKVTN